MQLEPDAWRLKTQEVSKAWGRLTRAEQAPFVAKAAAENGLRESASYEPYKSRGEQQGNLPSADSAAQQLTRTAKQRVSKQRLLASFRRFKDAPEWKAHDAGLASADGALDLDRIDLATPERQIQEDWQSFAKPHGELPAEWQAETRRLQEQFLDLDSNDPEKNLSCGCHAEFGICSSNPWSDLVSKSVNSLADSVNVRNSD